MEGVGLTSVTEVANVFRVLTFMEEQLAMSPKNACAGSYLFTYLPYFLD